MDQKALLLEIEKLSLIKQLSLIRELFSSPYERFIVAQDLFPEQISYDEYGQYIILTGIVKPGSEENKR